MTDLDDSDVPELTAEQRALLKEMLLEERERLHVRLSRHVSEAVTDGERPADALDVANRVSEQAYLLRLSDKEQKLLKQVNKALAKFEIGEYGICEGTGEPIVFKRLKARPWTRYTIEYKEQLERERGKHRRG
mgnify:CR=1 FL=1